MAARSYLPWLCVIFGVTLAVPTPGRIPKVYNALITSNQNLEPSKAFPVYQPVLHNTFPFPLQTVVYGDVPLSNGLIPPPPIPPSKDGEKKPEEAPSSTPEAAENAEPTEKPSPSPEPSPAPESDALPAPPPEPKTESPIPLNEFGLPPQVLPLGHLNPGYHYTPFPSFPYAYPGLRLYDPYDPFGFHAYSNWPLYQPLTNVLGPTLPFAPVKPASAAQPATPPEAEDKSAPAPPSEPSDLNVLNYSAKDPAIPNVPPPPLPQGGLKADPE